MGYANKVKEGGDFKPFPRGLKDGPNRRRVLPGIHSCSESGEWAHKHSTHTYKVPREDDPEKFDYFTFNCVEVVEWVNREKVVLESCPECVLIADQDEEFKKVQAKLKEELKSGARSKDEVRKLLRPFIEWKKRHGRSFWWAVNVQDPDQKFFTEKWPNDVKKQFDAEKKKLKDEDDIGAILPLEQGVWVDIIKTPGNETGTGFPEYKVQVAMERLEGGTKRIKLAPIPPESADEAEKSCWDITDPGIITLTRDQVKALASSGDAVAVVRGIFQQSQKTAKKTEAKAETRTPPAKAESAPPKAAPSTPATPDAPPAPKTPPAQESEDDRILREAEEAVAKARARREAARKAETGGAAPTAAAALATPPAPKNEAPPSAPAAPAKAESAPPKADSKPAPAKGGDNTDADLDRFMKEYELGGDEA